MGGEGWPPRAQAKPGSRSSRFARRQAEAAGSRRERGLGRAVLAHRASLVLRAMGNPCTASTKACAKPHLLPVVAEGAGAVSHALHAESVAVTPARAAWVGEWPLGRAAPFGMGRMALRSTARRYRVPRFDAARRSNLPRSAGGDGCCSAYALPSISGRSHAGTDDIENGRVHSPARAGSWRVLPFGANHAGGAAGSAHEGRPSCRVRGAEIGRRIGQWIHPLWCQPRPSEGTPQERRRSPGWQLRSHGDGGEAGKHRDRARYGLSLPGDRDRERARQVRDLVRSVACG
jgi:hypothetical protein